MLRSGRAPRGPEHGPGCAYLGKLHDGDTVVLVGTWQAEGEVGRPLLSALPQRLVRRKSEWDATLVDLLTAELMREEPGQEVVLDRLLDLVLVNVVRSWLSDQQTTPGLAAAIPWWTTCSGSCTIHPEHGWTIASLARDAGISRASLARRFAEVVGDPPMTYLTHWRLAMAADLLSSTDAGVDHIAREVGYSSPFALSAAFKRVRGVSPQQHRRDSRTIAS